MITFLINVLVFLAVLSVLVLVHELGHFIVAKKSGIKVEEFGFGLPPRLWGRKRGETLYSINALPIGGFVKLYGEEGEISPGEKPQKERAFFSKSKRIRFVVIIAGVVMNFLLSITIFSFIYTKLGIPTNTGKVIISEVAKDSPADKAQIKLDDVVVAVNGVKIDSSDKFSQIAKNLSGQKIQLQISREKDNPCRTGVLADVTNSPVCQGTDLIIGITPRKNPPTGEGPLGVGIVDDVTAKFYPLPKQIILGTVEGLRESLSWIKIITESLGKMVSQLFSKGQVPSDVAGPIGIFQATAQVSQAGFLSVLQFLGILSVNLAVINVLPFPALDGGRILFIVIEAVTRKKVRADIENQAHNIGMIFLLLLILIITIGDIARIVNANDIISRLRSILP